MVYPLTYRRPAFHPANSSSSSRDSISGEEKQKSINDSITSRESASSSMSAGIPEALSFDRIISGGTCPPCTTRDFMNYLKYIERAAENLQFFLWLQDYEKRFADLPESEKALSPEWTTEQMEAAEAATKQQKPTKMTPATAALFKGTDFEGPTEKGPNPFYTPPHTPSEDRNRAESDYGSSTLDEKSAYTSTKSYHQVKAEVAFEDAGMKWQPFTVQPFREEISRIIAIYVADGGPRQLNLSSREKAALLKALEVTTHPSAFRAVKLTVEWSLRCQAHPNFIRWTICNGNRPRVIFARGLGIFGILAALIAAVILTLSSAGRAWRVLAFAGFMFGISTLIAAWKGMCVVLHGMHHRHLRPWELFGEEADVVAEMESKNDSFETLGSSNSYEDEPWVAKYRKRNILRKILDRETWVQEPALRQIQDTIFLQAMLGAFILSAVATGIFCAIPKGNFF